MMNTIFSIEVLLHADFPGRMQQNEPLAAHSSAGVGGPADFFLDLHSATECEHLVHLCTQTRTPLLIIGNGSNILFTDQGVRRVVARMGAKNYRLEEQVGNEALAVIDAGLTWSELAEVMAQHGWSGLEWGRDIPGTLGGAIVTNAGFHNQEIGQHVQWVEVLDACGCNVEDGEWAVPQWRRYTQADLQLGNRQSRFREQRRAQITSSGQLVPAPRPMIAPPEIILQLGIGVQRANVLQEMDAREVFHRQINVFAGHLGPLFKDPVGMKASQVIEHAGLNALQAGEVQVSAHHANFLINRGSARASDMASMIVTIHQQVLERVGIDLAVDLEVYGM